MSMKNTNEQAGSGMRGLMEQQAGELGCSLHKDTSHASVWEGAQFFSARESTPWEITGVFLMPRENNNDSFGIPELGQSFIQAAKKNTNPAWQAATWNQRQALDLKPALSRKADEEGKRKLFVFGKTFFFFF